MPSTSRCSAWWPRFERSTRSNSVSDGRCDAIPEPIEGRPTSTEVPDATIDGGWIPTVGPAFPMSVLSLAPAEHDAMVDISEVLYLAPRGGEGFTMGNQHVVRDGLTRSQIEFVASRTSLINDCFF